MWRLREYLSSVAATGSAHATSFGCFIDRKVTILVKVALIKCSSSSGGSSYAAPPYPNIGIGYLSSLLKTNGYSSLAIDASFDNLSFDDVRQSLLDFQPDVIGFSAMTHEIVQTNKWANRLKGVFPNSMFLIGGPHATTGPANTLRQFTVFDILLFGEGENTLLDLLNSIDCDNISLGSISGIAWRDNNEILVNNPREYISNLDELPFPCYDHIRNRIPVYPIYSSRGCPYKCAFCCRVLGDKIRTRSAMNVIEEIKNGISKYHAKIVDFADEIFTLPKERAIEMCNLMIETGLNKKIKWTALSRINGVDQGLFNTMKKAGCYKVDFGVESGNQEILDRIKKSINVADVENTIKMAKNAGLKTGSYFIIGHPYETIQTINETIDLAARINTTTVSFGIMVPYPGTEVFEMAVKGEGNYRLISDNWEDYDKQLGNALELKGLSRSRLESMQRKAYLQFYLRNGRILDMMSLVISQRKYLFKMIRKWRKGPSSDFKREEEKEV